MSAVFIKRPVLSIVISLLIILVGVVSYLDLPLREYPKIDEPVVSVRTDFRGASPEIIESQITRPLEDSIAGIEGIKILSSTSRAETSRITIQFREYRDPDDAASDVRDRVARVRTKLPIEAKESRVSKVEADASPIVWLTLSSDVLSMMEISYLAKNIIKPRLQSLPGAADVRIFGDRKFSMRIWLDESQLVAYGLTVQDIERAIRQQNIEFPAGRIETPGREFSVIASTDLSTAFEFEEIILSSSQSSGLIKLKDVARVEIGPENERIIARFKGRPSVAMGIVKQATSNPLILSSAVEKNLPNILKDLPKEVDLEVAVDYSIFIDKSIKAVFKTILEAMLLVALVIIFSLKSFKASLIPIVTIPISLIGSFSIMLALGFTVNTLTLLAMVIAVGLVVDDAIVVLENISRHIENGKNSLDAAFTGMKEVGFAVVAMTLTLAAVFAPIVFAPGRTGRLFEEFALSLSSAVLISGVVALTLTPMMCRYLLGEGDIKNKPSQEKSLTIFSIKSFLEKTSYTLNILSSKYSVVLSWIIKKQWVVVVIFVSTLVLGFYSFSNVKKELAPSEDRGLILAVFLGPEGSSINYTNRYATEIEDILDKVPESEKYFVISGSPTVNKGIAFFRPYEWEKRERSIQEIATSIQPQLSSVPGVRSFPILPPAFGQKIRSRPIQIVVLSSGSMNDLSKINSELIEKLTSSGLLQGIDSDLILNKPELDIKINRDLAADLGISIAEIGRTLESLLGGRQVTRYREGNEQYDVIVQLKDEKRNNPNDIGDIYVRGFDEKLIPLSSIVSFKETVGPRELNHFSQRRAIKISAGLSPGVSMDKALSEVEKIARGVLPNDAQLDFDGQSREYFESKNTLTFVFFLSILFIFLVLSAQFESFIQPLVIVSTVPLALSGAMFSIFIAGGSLNVYSQIGLIALVGLISKHGILIVEFANKCVERGMSLPEAAVEAAKLRFRPIIMTTISTICGALPLALASGPGSEAREQIGWIVVGGMAFGTFLTLFILPTVYLWINLCVIFLSTRKQQD